MNSYRIEVEVNGRPIIMPRVNADDVMAARGEAWGKLALLGIDVREDDVEFLKVSKL